MKKESQSNCFSPKMFVYLHCEHINRLILRHSTAILLVLFFIFALLEVNARIVLPVTNSMMQTSETYPKLRQDSVRVHIVGNKSVTTFYVYAPESSDYVPRFWLMGVKHSDGTYSSYNFRIDQNPSTQQVKTTRGDWNTSAIYGTNTIYLSQGHHELHLEGTLSDVPNAERVICKTSLSPFNDPIQVSATTLYNSYKSDHDYYYSAFAPTQEDYRTISYCTTEGSPTLPAYHYSAELNKKVFYTFFRLEYYTAGQNINYQTEKINGIDHVLHVFSQFDNGQYHSMASSVGSTGISFTYTVPITGFYYVLLRSYSPDEYGICNLSIDGSRLFDDIPICCSYTEINSPASNEMYSCFAKSISGDPLIILMNPTYGGSMVKYNDDFPFNFLVTDYNWSKNARFDSYLSQGQWLFTTSKSYPDYDAYRFDIYTRCLRLGTEYFLPYFPLYQAEDIMISSAPTSRYNCISWAVGEWNIAFWIGDDIGNNIASFDSLFNAYGYTRDGATVDNSSVDLWATPIVNGVRDITHASIRAKQNNYAAGYAWESKLGPYYRVFHPRYALNGNTYGYVEYYYKKTGGNGVVPPMPILLNIELTSDEYERIGTGIDQIPSSLLDHFTELYDKCQEDGILRVNINIDRYDLLGNYDDLLAFCIDNPSLKSILYSKICKQEPLAIKLLKDVSHKESPQLWCDIINELSKRCVWSEGKIIICPMQAYAMTLVKAMLGKSEKKKEIEALAENSTTFSTDPVFDVKTKGRDLSISFDLLTDADVAVIVGNIETRQLLNIINSKVLKAGHHNVTVTLPSSGVYSIGLTVNGCVYKKKIYVK